MLNEEHKLQMARIQIEKLELNLQEQVTKNLAQATENEKLQENLLEKEKAPTSHFFPFQVSTITKDCVMSSKIKSISQAVKDLNENHKIRIFPRNGFLLGVIRHGGFLPNENIDADLGVISTDLDNLKASQANRVGDFTITPMPTETHWVNWKGNNPITGKHYPFFGVKISGPPSFSETVTSFYPYRNNTYFYPRANLEGYNHAGNAKEMQRWNKEDANFRLVDTDELITESNFEKGKQIGHVFHSTFDCMVEKQFYFTTILVPCDYEAILTVQYGKNWRRVEKRQSWESLALSEKQNEKFLKFGPRPLCARWT